MSKKKTLSRIAEICLALAITLIVISVFAYVYAVKVNEPNSPLYYWTTPYRQYTFPLVLGAIILSIAGLASLVKAALIQEAKAGIR